MTESQQADRVAEFNELFAWHQSCQLARHFGDTPPPAPWDDCDEKWDVEGDLDADADADSEGE